jgi:hypothetical protein
MLLHIALDIDRSGLLSSLEAFVLVFVFALRREEAAVRNTPSLLIQLSGLCIKSGLLREAEDAVATDKARAFILHW